MDGASVRLKDYPGLTMECGRHRLRQWSPSNKASRSETNIASSLNGFPGRAGLSPSPPTAPRSTHSN
ncbi:hypothetical protein Pmani_036814 [Petrolisthes manimaculis]|uniref:Uncharacterized protein n=1 Tax=Petrolisthes manimaculis TaxID=1843537 RepID=A0AAE1TMB4_9EUCA|nr:hypothetical protein Pmani_036814 [Petrolisthes manimaculis]